MRAIPQLADSAPAKAWEPLVSAEVRGEALASAAAVGRRLRVTMDSKDAPLDGSLAAGWAGATLLFAYLYEVFGDERWARDLERALDLSLTSADDDSSLFGGVPGTHWCVAHLRTMGWDLPDFGFPEALIDYLSSDVRAGQLSYDLTHGLVGLGAYFLELDGEHRTAGITLVERRLEATRPDNGSLWLRSRNNFPEWDCPPDDANTDYGVAHGLGGLLGFYTACTGTRRSSSHSSEAAAIVRCLLEARGSGPHSIIPALRRTDRLISSRTAWCYGDAGVSLVLARAAHSVDESGLWDEAESWARAVCKRPRALMDLEGKGICHGTAGIALILARWTRLSDCEVIRRSACHWADEVVADVVRIADSPSPSELGLLEGEIGVALVALAVASGTAPAWDRAFLLSARSCTA